MFAYLSESINGTFRDRSLIGCYLFWSIGEIAMSGAAYFIPNWRTSMLVTMAIP